MALGANLAAQTSSKARGPRALAVVELSGSKKDSAKLYPISLFERGNYFDAAIYNVNPMPMAVEPGIVYEVQRSGEPLGLVTIDQALQQNGEWIATGRLQPEGSENKNAKSAGASSASNDEPPVLKRGQSSAAAASTPPTVASTAANPAPSAPSADTDVNRPVLRRGKPPKNQAPVEKPTPAQATKTTAAAPPASTPKPAELLVAVSDATPSDQHSYKFDWKPEEKTKLSLRMGRFESRIIEPYNRQHHLQLAQDDLFGFSIRAFDLFYDNDAEIIYTTEHTASPPPPAKQQVKIYVTVVALLNSSGELRQLFSEVTDDRHLDVAGRLELIDAVDADGDSRGELLFRRIAAGASRYELYRVTRDQLYRLFASK